jgi:broad specificity phosphatase PhoE
VPSGLASSARPRTGWRQGRGEPVTTVLLRHGETALSAERRFAGRGDLPLTDLGEKQAAAAAARLAGRKVDAIVSSPLRRARQTADAVAASVGVPVTLEDGLMEVDFGEWEGLTFAEARERWPDELTAWLADPSVAPPGGEGFDDAAVRVGPALDRVLAAHPAESVVVVSHVTPIKTVICRAMLAPPAAMFRFHLDLASLTEIDWFADGPVLLRSLNDTAHLAGAGG